MVEFRIGDLVRRKSGGLHMTVTYVYLSGPDGETVTHMPAEDEGRCRAHVICHWFEDNDVGEMVLRSEDFPPAALVKDVGARQAL